MVDLIIHHLTHNQEFIGLSTEETVRNNLTRIIETGQDEIKSKKAKNAETMLSETMFEVEANNKKSHSFVELPISMEID